MGITEQQSRRTSSPKPRMTCAIALGMAALLAGCAGGPEPEPVEPVTVTVTADPSASTPAPGPNAPTASSTVPPAAFGGLAGSFRKVAASTGLTVGMAIAPVGGRPSRR